MTSSALQLTGRSSSNIPTSDSDKILTRARKNLRKHIGLGPEPGDPCPEPPEDLRLFFVEIAPYSHNGAKCKLSICGSRIQPGHFRFAVMGQNKWSAVGKSIRYSTITIKLNDPLLRFVPYPLFRVNRRFFTRVYRPSLASN